MTFTNNKARYGAIAKSFHWLCAALFAISYISIYYRNLFAVSDFQTWVAVQLHMSIGISFFGVIVLRLVWRAADNSVHMTAVSKLHLVTVKLGHGMLYLVMIIMPATGLLSLINYLSNGSGHVDFFFIYDLDFSFLSSAISQDEIMLSDIENASSNIHEYMGRFLAPALILAHIAAALTHHYVIRDNTLHKMTFSFRRSA